MQSINEIETHLQGLEDIKHLLRSVRAMSAIRWRKAKQHLEIAQDYAGLVDKQLGIVFSKFGSKISEEISHLNSSRSDKKIVGLITLTSDRGLCGNFNTGLVSKAFFVEDVLKKKNKEVRIISLGGYGERMFRDAGYDILLSEKIQHAQAVSFVNIRKALSHIRVLYEERVIDELNILYNQFNYFGSYTPKSVQILPPRFSEIEQDVKKVREDLMINSNPDELKTFLIWEHLTSRLYLAFIESTISEHSARLQTMDAAISNLDDKVSDLEIQYHTIRQEKITQEVLEVQGNMRDRKKKKRSY